VSKGGYIYVITAVSTGLVKIGSTTGAVEDRVKVLQTGQPFTLEVVAQVPVEERLVQVEHAVQTLLVNQKLRGEWFATTLDTDALQALIQQAQQILKTRTQGKLRTTAQQYMHKQQQLTGGRIQAIRTERRLTQKALAHQCGFPYQVINRVEQGHQDIYAQRLALIAHTLNVSADYLLGLTEQP